MDYKTLYEQSQVKISQLEQERDFYKMDIEEKNHTIITWKMSASLKQTEINELTEKITCLESDSHNEVSIAEYDELKERTDELEKENDELKKENQQLRKSSNKLIPTQKKIQAIVDENEKMKAFINELKINVVKLDVEVDENQKLKDEIEELKKELKKARVLHLPYAEWREKVLKKKDELEKENKELDNCFRYHQCLIHFLDPNGNADTPEKEDIDSFCEEFQYNKDMKQTLYDDFNIEEFEIKALDED